MGVAVCPWGVVCDITCRSYGVLLWEIMTLGRTPYPGVDNRDVLKEIEENNLRLSEPKDCPKSMYVLLLLSW